MRTASRAGNGITMNDNSSRISIGAASKMSNTVPSDAADGISNGASTIKFFARVYSPSGTTEVLLPTEQFTGDPDAIKQYAEWKQQEEGMSLTFDQFVKIFGFARKELMAGPKKGV
jgi:hypothetical protein